MNKKIITLTLNDLINNYEKLSSLAKEKPVAITVNGKEDLVILSHEQYSIEQNYILELETKIALYNHLAQSMDDIKFGKMQKLDEAKNEILKELQQIKL